MSLRIPSTWLGIYLSAQNNVDVAVQQEGKAKDSISEEKNEINCQLDLSQKLPLPQAQEMVKLVSQPDTAYQWREKHPGCLIDADGNFHYSHTRKIFISMSDPSLPRLVAKMKTVEMRNKKLELKLPHAEEISYKICKQFHWNTVPKTKMLHQYSMLQENTKEKYQKYIKLMNYFKCEQDPFTFTFQSFVEGEALPQKVTNNIQDPNLSSYQKAYLLGIVLGKFDARGDNTILNHQTGQLFEIDNEYIGENRYERSGILNGFKKLKSKEISFEILNDVLNTQLAQLGKIRDKYKVRDENLIKLWNSEPKPTDSDYEIRRDDCWSTIMENFKFLRMSIIALSEKKELITIEKLNSRIHDLHLFDRSPKVFHFDNFGRTCLHQASITDTEGDFIVTLIKAGALIDQKDNFSRTSLDIAIAGKNIKAVEILIQSGAMISPENHKALEDKLFASIHKFIGIRV